MTAFAASSSAMAGHGSGDLGQVHGAVLVDQAAVAELAAVIELAAAVVTSARCTGPSWSSRAYSFAFARVAIIRTL